MNKSRRAWTLGLGIFIFLSTALVNPIESQGATQVGSKCSIEGEAKNIGNKYVVCKQVKGKSIWNFIATSVPISPEIDFTSKVSFLKNQDIRIIVQFKTPQDLRSRQILKIGGQIGLAKSSQDSVSSNFVFEENVYDKNGFPKKEIVINFAKDQYFSNPNLGFKEWANGFGVVEIFLINKSGTSNYSRIASFKLPIVNGLLAPVVENLSKVITQYSTPAVASNNNQANPIPAPSSVPTPRATSNQSTVPVTSSQPTEQCTPFPPRTYPTVTPSLSVRSDNEKFVFFTIDVATAPNMNRELALAKLICQKIENISFNVWFKSQYHVKTDLFTSSNWISDTFTFSILKANGEVQLPNTFRLDIPLPQEFLGGAGKVSASFLTSLKQITGYNGGPYSKIIEYVP